ncbi:MAG TPA: cytochrome c biogenesis protein CcdA [Gemmataceae bacterium]|nr:cytochrome c biogenesis protein CcdA [Gemmataceae bacterium]
MKRFAFLCIACVVAIASPVVAERKPPGIAWETAVRSVEGKIEPAAAKPGQTVTYKLIIRLFPEHLTYPTRQPDQKASSQQNQFTLPPPGDLVFVGPFTDPPNAHQKPNPGADGSTIAYYPEGAVWEFKAVVAPLAKPGERMVTVALNQLLICNDDNCIPPKKIPITQIAIPFTVLEGSAAIDPALKDAVDKSLAAPAPIVIPVPEPVTPKGPDSVPPINVEGPKAVAHRLSPGQDHAADLAAVLEQLPKPTSKSSGFWTFVATAAFWGFVTLLTPCVFPMVPITVSIFLKQSEKQGTNVLALALVYAITIVILLSLAAMFLLTAFSRLAVHPVTNVLLGTLFVVLALSLFGLFEITLPSSVATALDNRAARGGYGGTVFMAASFTVVSFTCVAPFLGGFSGLAASGNFNYFELAAGAVAFATAFASPFFLLALFPSLIKKLPKSGDWMNMVKVTMGFLELAAALKFLRTAELQWLTPPRYFTYDMVLALWIGILVAMSLYLFGVFRTKHDHEFHDHVGPWRIMFALATLGLAVYLLPALFANGPRERNRPAGTVYAWVDAFLLPEPSAAEAVSGDLPWSADLRKALDDARGRNGRVFVDFTGITCNNCKLNEYNVFVKPEIRDLFKQYTLVQMYTDTIPEIFYDSDPGRTRRKQDAEMNLKFEEDAFREQQLPLYVILKPERGGKTSVVGIYDEGKINNERAFIEFLKNGLK